CLRCRQDVPESPWRAPPPSTFVHGIVELGSSLQRKKWPTSAFTVLAYGVRFRPGLRAEHGIGRNSTRRRAGKTIFGPEPAVEIDEQRVGIVVHALGTDTFGWFGGTVIIVHPGPSGRLFGNRDVCTRGSGRIGAGIGRPRARSFVRGREACARGRAGETAVSARQVFIGYNVGEHCFPAVHVGFASAGGRRNAALAVAEPVDNAVCPLH